MSSSKDLISEIFTEWEEQYSNIPYISIPTTQPPTTTATILTSSSDDQIGELILSNLAIKHKNEKLHVTMCIEINRPSKKLIFYFVFLVFRSKKLKNSFLCS